MSIFGANSFAQKPELVIQKGHSADVTGLLVSHNGKFLASCAYDKTIVLWDAESGNQIRTLSGHKNYVTCIALTPDDRYLISGGGWGDNTIKIWDVHSGKEIGSLDFHSKPLVSLSYCESKNLVVGKSSDGTIIVWDFPTRKIISTFDKISNSNTMALISPDGDLIFTATQDNSILVLSLSTGKEVRRMAGHKNIINALALSSAGTMLASGASDKEIKLWDIASGVCSGTLAGHTLGVKSLAFSKDDKYLASGSMDKSVRLWYLATFAQLINFEGHDGAVNSLAFSNDGFNIFSGCSDSKIIKWDIRRNGRIDNVLKGHSDIVSALALSPDSRLVAASGGMAETIRLWDLFSGTNFRTLKGHAYRVSSLAFSPDGKSLASGSDDKVVKIWDINSGLETKPLYGHRGKVSSVVWSTDGNNVASASADSTVIVWDIEKAKPIFTLKGHTDRVTSLAYSPDGKYLASGSADKSIIIWDASSGDKVRTLTGHKLPVTALTYADNAKYLISASQDKTIKIWNTESGEEIRSIDAHKDIVTSLAYDKNSKRIFSGSFDNIIHVWDFPGGASKGSLNSHTAAVSGIAVSASSKFIITSGWDCTLKLWSYDNLKMLGTMISLDRNEWAIVTPDAVYDASSAASHLLHFTIGMETIQLNQLKDKFYEPLLLSKLAGFNKEPVRPAPDLSGLKLYPQFQLNDIGESENLIVDVNSANENIGRIAVYLNKKELYEDARNFRIASDNTKSTYDIPFKDSKLIMPGDTNIISVRLYNPDGNLYSKDKILRYLAPAAEQKYIPQLWAIIVGVSDYQGEALDLKYAAKDAADFSRAVTIAGTELFGNDNIHIKTLTALKGTDNTGTARPTKDNLRLALLELQDSKPGDVSLIYFAGHGINLGEEDRDFFYLTSEVGPDDNLKDKSIQSRKLLSSAELTELIRKIPASKQVLVVDACASGKLVETFSDSLSRSKFRTQSDNSLISFVSEDVPSSQRRAFERMKDRSGLHIISGCASDAVSYESSQFGQGFLTYSLLMGMRGAALSEDKYVDVKTLFNFAEDKVPQLAKGVSGIQKPQIASPYGGESFDLGIINPDDRSKIPLAKTLPVFVHSNFQNEDSFDDNFKLAKLIDDKFRDLSDISIEPSQGLQRVVFIESDTYPDAYQLIGRYKVQGNKIAVTAKLKKISDSETSSKDLKINSTADDKSALVNKLLRSVFSSITVR